MDLQYLQKKEAPRGKVKIIFLLMALPLLFLLIYWFGWRQSPPAPDEAGAPRAKSGLERLEELLQITAYRDLRKFGPWPLPIDPKGKSNPFLNSSQN